MIECNFCYGPTNGHSCIDAGGIGAVECIESIDGIGGSGGFGMRHIIMSVKVHTIGYFISE